MSSMAISPTSQPRALEERERAAAARARFEDDHAALDALAADDSSARADCATT